MPPRSVCGKLFRRLLLALAAAGFLGLFLTLTAAGLLGLFLALAAAGLLGLLLGGSVLAALAALFLAGLAGLLGHLNGDVGHSLVHDSVEIGLFGGLEGTLELLQLGLHGLDLLGHGAHLGAQLGDQALGGILALLIEGLAQLQIRLLQIALLRVQVHGQLGDAGCDSMLIH